MCLSGRIRGELGHTSRKTRGTIRSGAFRLRLPPCSSSRSRRPTTRWSGRRSRSPRRAGWSARAWAMQGYGTPLGRLSRLRAARSLSTSAAGSSSAASRPAWAALADIGSWWLRPVAFQKAILWSMLFEGLGLGCGSGPLTGRYVPPIGGALYFLRPGTTKLPLFAGPAADRRHRGAPGSTSRSTRRCVALVVARAGRADARRPELLIAIARARPACSGCSTRRSSSARAASTTGPRSWSSCSLRDFVPGAKARAAALWFWAGVLQAQPPLSRPWSA